MQNPTVAVGKIRLGRNPRKYFDAAEMAELTDSVRLNGVIQPILLRPLGEDRYELVAGERRWRAAQAAHGDHYEIPIILREMTEEEADRLALIENIQRADMAPSEEAVAAAKIVGQYKGDRDEAAKVLGWSRSKLDSRLALMNCSVAVLDALNTRAIQLGHAELLATLAKDKQDAILPAIISEKKPVSELKKAIEAAACSLASAVFDKTECASCPHNSSLQTEMFGEAIASGNCTNKACYNEKTDKKLDGIVTGLKDEYQIVRIVRPGDNHTRIQIAVEGAHGVGEEQAKACHGCQNFGAAVSALPDSIGRVFSGQCFDTTCHSKKVAARLKAARDAKAATAQPTQAAKSAPAKKGSAASAPAEKAVTSISESEKVKAYRTGIWRLALRREVARSPMVANSYLVAIALTGLARDIKSDAMGKIFEKLMDDKSSASDLGKNLSLVADLADDKRHNLTIGLTVAAIEGLDVSNLVSLCKHHKLDLRQHWNLQKSKDFLEMLTKAEMKVLADELGIRQALGDGFAKLFNKSKPEVVEALLNVECFDYTGKVPKVLCF